MKGLEMLIGCTGGSVCSILRPSGVLLPLCERKHPKAALADQVHQRLHPDLVGTCSC